jgi:hypothetical protein
VESKKIIHSDLGLPSRIRHIVGRKGSEKTIYTNLKSFKALFMGLDTLHLTYKGIINKNWWDYAHLKERKRISQGNPFVPVVTPEGETIDFHYVTIGDQDWMVSPSGTKEYAYCLQRNDWRIFILSNRGLKNSIQLKIEVPSIRLRVGLWGLRKEISYLVEHLMSSAEESVQRVDMTVDIEGFRLAANSGLMFYGRPRKIKLINGELPCNQFLSLGDIGKVETLMIGKNPLLRIYDKLSLAIKQDISWFPLWYEKPYENMLQEVGDDKSKLKPITRFEFQLRGNILKEFQITGLDSLQEKFQGLWNYLTLDWLHCKQKVDGIKNKKNFPTAGIWEFISKIPFGPDCEIERVRSISRDSRKNFHQLFGALSSILAKENILIQAETEEEYKQILLKYFGNFLENPQWFNNKKFAYQHTKKLVLLQGQNVKPPLIH